MPLNHSADYWRSPIGIDLLHLVEQLLIRYNHDPSPVALYLHQNHTATVERTIRSEAIEISLARLKAKKFGLAPADWLLSKQSLEQSTHPVIAEAHAVRFKGCQNVLEICTGAGFDTAALAHFASNVLSIVANSNLAGFAEHNLAISGFDNVRIETGLAEHLTAKFDTSGFDGLWADPSRRSEHGRRIMYPSRYKPSLDFLLDLEVPGIRGIKVSPALGLRSLPSGWVRQWIGHDNECREQVLWYGTDLANRSVHLTDHNLHWSSALAPADQPPAADVSIEECNYLIEPHPALIASGCVRTFFAENHFHTLDSELVIGASKNLVQPDPFYSVFRCIDCFPFSLKRLKRALNTLGWGRRTEIKKRMLDDDPEELRRKLRLPDSSDFGSIILLGIKQKKWVFLTQRVVNSASA